MAFSKQEKEWLSHVGAVRGKGEEAVKGIARIVSRQREPFKRFVFDTLFQNLNQTQADRLRDFLNVGDTVPVDTLRQNLVNMLSANEHRDWLQKVMEHEHVVRGFETAGASYLFGKPGPTFRKALKGNRGISGALHGFRLPREILAEQMLEALHVVGLPQAQQPADREAEPEADPYGDFPDPAKRIAHEYLDPIKIPVYRLVKRGLHQYAATVMDEPHRIQVQHTGRLPHFASNLVDTASEFVKAMAGEGLSRKNLDVNALVTHAWNSTNYDDFRRRMTVAVQQGTRKVDISSPEATFLKRFFLPAGGAYAPHGGKIEDKDISAHNIHELHRRLSTEKDFVPWSNDQKSARAFYEMVRLAKVAGGTNPATEKHLRQFVRAVHDHHDEFIDDMKHLSRGRPVSPARQRDMFVELVRAHGPEEGARLYREAETRAARERRRR